MTKKDITLVDDDFTEAPSTAPVETDYNVKSIVRKTVSIGCMECHPGTILNLPLSKSRQLQDLQFVEIIGL